MGRRVTIKSAAGAFLGSAESVGSVVSVVIDPSAPARVKSLLSRIGRRGVLEPDDIEEPPPGFHFEPLSDRNLGRVVDEVAALYPEVDLRVLEESVG